MEIDSLLKIMALLRDPERGCPWDLEQDFASIAPHTIEEAYEVADAIERHDMSGLKDELGDLLFQVVFHAQMAREAGQFDFAAVTAAICDKMRRRHPHVFADAVIESADAQSGAWEAMKAAERQAQGEHSALDGITRGLPEWQRAGKLHSRAARVGFDWPDVAAVFGKVDEELIELKEAVDSDAEGAAVAEEFGDMMFAMLALARHLKVDAGSALRAANRKFEARFRAVEKLARRGGQDLTKLDEGELDSLWEQVKANEP